MKNWKVILASVLIFSCGIITGAVIYRFTLAPPPETSGRQARPPIEPGPRRMWFIRQLEEKLQLSPEQKQKIEAALKASHERVEAAWKPVAPVMKQEFEWVHAEIEKILTPDQRRRFEELIERHRRGPGDRDPDRRKMWRGGEGEPPPPHGPRPPNADDSAGTYPRKSQPPPHFENRISTNRTQPEGSEEQEPAPKPQPLR